MQFIISLKTSMFDVSKEDKNPINPIFGKSLLVWLKDKISDSVEIDDPDAEDWGWYSYINWKGRRYLLGSTAYVEEGDDPSAEIEYIFQVDKVRSLSEKLFGREKMTHNDDCFMYIKSLFESEKEMNEVTTEGSVQ